MSAIKIRTTLFLPIVKRASPTLGSFVKVQKIPIDRPSRYIECKFSCIIDRVVASEVGNNMVDTDLGRCHNMS